MVDATFSRDNTSVDIPLLGEPGNLAVGRDVGKPNLEIKDVGREDPRSSDHFGPGDGVILAGLLLGSDAYADAQTLANIVKSRGESDSPLELDLSGLPEYSSYEVGVPTSGALTLTYVPGRRQLVGVQLTVTFVSATIGGSQDGPVSRSVEAESGGITVSRGGTGVTLTENLEVVRKVGRPGAEPKPTPGQLPRYVDDNVPASDVFEISGEIVGDVDGESADARARTLVEDVVRPPLGRSDLTLSFDGNLYGLGGYAVVPEGSQGVRAVHATGRTNVVSIPTLELRVVNNS